MNAIERLFAEHAEYYAEQAWEAAQTGSAIGFKYFKQMARDDAAYAAYNKHSDAPCGSRS